MSYFRHIWKFNRGFAFFSMVFIGFFQFLILYLVTTFDANAILTAIMNQIPAKMRMLLNDSFFSMLSFDGAAAFGFNHPLVLAVLAVAAINIPVRHISRELEGGTLELLVSLPFKRRHLILKLWTSGLLILSVIVLVSFLASLFAIRIFHQLTWQVAYRLLLICFNLWLFFTVVMSYSLLISALSKGSGYAANLSAMITLVLYFLYFAGQLWPPLAFSLHFNIFHYYNPQEIMCDKGELLSDVAVLFVLAILLMLASSVSFEKRDIP